MAAFHAVGLIAKSISGGCKEVLEVAITDYGGNVLGKAKTPRGAMRIKNRYRVLTRFKILRLGEIVPAESYLQGYTVDCGYYE